jgi:hypothetical protein
VLCRGLEKKGMVGAWHGHGMASVNQTRPRCVNQMGKTHSKPLAARHGRGKAWARHGRGKAWARHAMCESAFSLWSASTSMALPRPSAVRQGRGRAGAGHQTWPHCVNQMGKTHSKPLAARHGRGTA